MAARRTDIQQPAKNRRPPATTPEARENQMIALASDLAEKQLRDGTASSQLMTHFLKMATSREKLEQERLRSENELLKAKIDHLASQANIEELYKDAIDAMRGYGGKTFSEDPDA